MEIVYPDALRACNHPIHCQDCGLSGPPISPNLTESDAEARPPLGTPPKWLAVLLETDFYVSCSCGRGRSRNMYCINCAAALCMECLAERHIGHKIVQVRRSSYKDVIRFADIDKLMDTSGIQHYSINGYPVAFVKTRHPKRDTHGTSSCIICGRTIMLKRSFCSIGCKFAWATKTGDAMALKEGGCISSTTSDVFRARKKKIKKNDTGNAWSKLASKVDRSSGCCKPKNRRKGTPHRAPEGGVYGIF